MINVGMVCFQVVNSFILVAGKYQANVLIKVVRRIGKLKVIILLLAVASSDLARSFVMAINIMVKLKR